MSETNPPDGELQSPILAERHAKLARLRELGPAYPNDFVRTATAAGLHARYAQASRDELAAAAVPVSVAGRLMLKRLQGKVSFATVQDGSGRIQLFVSDDDAGAAAHEAFRHWDIGDIVGAEGVLFRTNRGELSVRCRTLRLLAKALRPLPDKFHGLADQEMRYRQRYVDLIVNESTRTTFQIRSRAVAELRRLMTEQGFLEVETPMLQLIPGGAAARPFVTHHHALDIDMYLRIAPELYLKRLVVGGFERVFEINRNFRNEGISPRHNPEFTMLEFYAAYQDVRWMMDFTEQLLRQTALAATGSAALSYQGQTINLAPSFERLTITQAILRHHPGYSPTTLSDPFWLIPELERLGAEAPPGAGVGSLQLTLFEYVAEPKLVQPTFIIDYPVEVSPLARASDQRPDVAERFELFIGGRETANGFSELNDPEDQAGRFRAQAQARQAGDQEAMYYDADYIRALEYAMPPAAGCGIGVDRFVMLLADAPSIRDVILFPHMRPEDPV
ncbi:MAG TPA: lysine--tRNA ligase [Burkholderiaceae bacterium]|jgi:lysyl-tRNA synthetase class 2|nr:lysine--tRNA ligase [Burkholderiaceae bacterium]